MSERPRLPETLRRAVVADLRPVKPLPPPAVRALEVALWGVVALVAAPAVFGVRHDVQVLGVMLTWGAAMLECVAGVLVVALALREAIPGAGVGRSRLLAAMAGGVAVQTSVAVLTWMVGPAATPEMLARHSGAKCFAMQGALALPALAITAVLVLRALPLQPPWAGALAGLGAGLVADGAWHMVCPMCDLRHLLVWHGAATVGMVAGGWLLGVVWERVREARGSLRGADAR
jgi:hypothetical protein